MPKTSAPGPTPGAFYAYRIFDVRDGKPCTLFHGLHGSRTLCTNCWLSAELKLVTNPGKKGKGRKFISGFHVVPKKRDCEHYTARFKNMTNRVVCRVIVKSLRIKPGSEVKLADEMKIKESDWQTALANKSRPKPAT